MQQRRSPRLAASNGSSPATNGTNGHYTNGKAAKSKVMNELTDTGENILQKLWNRTISPLFLICTCPNAVLLLWYTAVHCNGSYLLLGQELMRKGVFTGLAHIWGKVNFFSPLAAGVILGYGLFAMFLQVTMPGPRAEGPVTPHGNTPVYKDNGFTCYVVTMISFCALTYYLKSNGMTPTIIYDHFEEFLGTLTVGSMIFCVGLYLKGLLAPSTTDSGSSGNPIFDYYWGTELYPRVFGVDIKVFTNCRFGMTVWPLLVLIFSLKSYELYGFVDSAWISCFLHFVYFTKFFWWEIGYMGTIDIMVDRAGYYICWGCMVFIPGMYAVTSLYLVNHPVHLGLPLGLLITVLGFASTVINYWADLQKQQVRSSKGNCTIWGRKPEVIHAKYQLNSGETRESLLLVSGWWGVARHFHYVPELALAFFWCMPGLFDNVMCYTYFLWLCILLTHRTFRDDQKCGKKYGKYWQQYCKRVPYKMIPYVF